MSLNVGSISVGMNVDLAEFQSGMQKATDLARSNVSNMSAEMKRTSREGSEAFRLIDEAIGLHLSRPITRILTQEFPSLAKGLQSILGVGLTAAVGVAAFEFVEKGLERIGKAMEDAKKKEEAFADSTHALNALLGEQNTSYEQSLDRIKQKLAELSGDKASALAANLRIITRSDADEAVKAIDAISAAYVKNAKDAAEAAAWTTKFLEAARNLTTSPFDLGNERITQQAKEIKNTLQDIVQADPLKGLENGAKYLQEQLTAAQAIQKDMETNQLSSVDAFLAKLSFTDAIVAHRGAVTKEEVLNHAALVASLQKELETFQHFSTVDTGNKKVAVAQSAGQRDIGEKELTKLSAETEAQLQLAAASSQSVAAQKLQLASGQADELISRILEEAHGRLTTAVLKEIAAVHALTAERQVAKDAVQLNQELEKETEAYGRQIESLRTLAAAYAQGGNAVPEALLSKQLDADKQKVAELTEEYSRLEAASAEYAAGKARLGTAAGPVQGIQGVDPKALADLKIALDQANVALAQHKQQLEDIRAANYDVEINKESEALRGEQPLLDALNSAYFQNAQAVRQAQVALALYHWEQAHPGASPDQTAGVKAQLEQQSLNAQRVSDTQLAYRYAITQSYDDEMAKLERAREILQQYGESTLLIDSQIYDERLKMLKQWDDAAFKVGDFSQKYQAVMNELVIQGKEAGSQITRAFLGAIDQAETDLAKALTGQKVDGKKIVQNLAEQVTKAELQSTFGKIAGSIGIKVPGLEGKPDGSASNPLHVVVGNSLKASVSGAGGIGSTPPFFGDSETRNQGAIFEDWGKKSGAGNLLGSIGGFLKSLFSKKNSVPFTAGDLGAPTAIPGVVGATGPSFSFPEIAGFMADGGDLTPGKNYIVGERGTELLRIPLGGHITPNSELRGISSQGGDTNHNTQITQNFHGIKDSDMFRRSVRQENARMFRHLK